MASSKFKFEPISDKYTENLKEKSIGRKQSHSDMIVSPPGCVLPWPFKDAMERIQNFTILPDDTWVVTFPKCGTTWSQEMIWLLINNFDFEKAKSVDLRYRVPFFEFEHIMSAEDEPPPPTMEICEKLTPPRCIKSHLPLELLPEQIWTLKPKIIYVARDPRDVAISYYHHHRLWNGYQGTMEEFVDAFLHDRVVYGPYWSHLLSAIDLEDKSHVLINTYEEMKQDLGKVIRKTAKFLGVEVTDKQVEDLKEHLSFENMKDNKRVNCSDSEREAKKKMNVDDSDENLRFIRKGQSGGWKTTFGNDIVEKFNKWNEQHLKGRKFTDYPWS